MNKVEFGKNHLQTLKLAYKANCLLDLQAEHFSYTL